MTPRKESRICPPAKESAPDTLSRPSVLNVLTNAVTALELPRGLTYEAWSELGSRLSCIASTSAWWLGDWLTYGESRFPDRYKQAIEETQLDYQTLRNYSWVARKFCQSRRRDTLSFQHHAEVASLVKQEQDIWLDRAERFSWSRNTLRSYLRISRRNAGLGVHDDCDQEVIKISVNVEREKGTRWQEAAKRTNQSLDDWMTSVLDQVAEVMLKPPGVRSLRRGLAIEGLSPMASGSSGNGRELA